MTSLLSIIFILIAIIGWILALTGSLKRNLHILQLEDYEPDRMLRDLIRYPRKLQLLGPELIGGLVALTGCAAMVYSLEPDLLALARIITVIGLALWGLGCAWRAVRMRRSLRNAKKPLVMTSRARRIYFTSLAVALGVFCILYMINLNSFRSYKYVNVQYIKYIQGARASDCEIGWNDPTGDEEEKGVRVDFPELSKRAAFYLLIFCLLISMYLIERLAAIWLSISVWILSPFEASIQRRYLSDARRILNEINPLVIGITGSYGKTGTKEMLTAMLAEKYSVFCPPGSYNTLMGITRVIREQLRPFHEIFVVEMGAYRIGSIARLCRLVEPMHGIITTIGIQHLERFKTQEAIRIAKSELIGALPENGIAVLNGDDPACRDIGAAFRGKVVYFRMEDNGIADRNVCATGIPTVLVQYLKVGSEGSDFDIVYPDGESSHVHLSLLGRSAVANGAAAAAMADQLGVPRRKIVRVLAGMPHVKHRLEPIRREDGIIVLDNAFNSNPIGAKNALEVLATAKDGRRILVTPGMIELGALEEEANYEFGRQAAAACDLAVLVGVKRVEPIRRGLLDSGFKADNIWVVQSLNEGLDRLGSYLKPGDTMLLENDLPDQYSSV